MTSNIDIEAKVIQRFVIKTKQDRYLTFIKSEKTRPKFINDLSHINFLREDLFDKVEGNEYEFIKQRIKALGNLKDCYVISENKLIDKKRLGIDTALTETIGADQGTLLVFGDAEILYSEAEGFNNRWISKQTPFI
jgi:predicted patatin/cPLA2 family phospholipase